jgi:hypothetical protein
VPLGAGRGGEAPKIIMMKLGGFWLIRAMTAGEDRRSTPGFVDVL